MRYKALALQVTCPSVNSCANAVNAENLMLETLMRLRAQIAASVGFIGRDCRLVVLPEYFLTGFPMGETLQVWREKAALYFDGRVFEELKSMACDLGVFLSGNAYERDEHFPDLYFQSSFIINAQGALILKYRRLNSMFAPTPHDVWQRYLDIYGYESLFPVVKTELGNLACIASEEILYPEIARCLAMRGAEVFLHSSSEVGSTLLTQKNVAKLARAIENMGYVVSANSAGISGTAIPMASTDGSSKVVNYQGLVLAEAAYGESMVANADIDLEALRAHRSKPSMSHFLARQRFELYAESYANHSFYPPDNITAVEDQPDRAHFVKMQMAVIKKLFS
jgi:predicted amidohydrolase